MEQYPSNSREGKPPAKKAVPEPKSVEQVTQGSVVRRKKSMGRRFSETFFNGNAKEAAMYVAWDVLIPSAKDMVVESFMQGLERFFYGNDPRRQRRGPSAGLFGNPSTGFMAYNRMSQPPGSPLGMATQPARPELSRMARATHNFDEVVLSSRADAENVIDSLFELVSKYGQANVGDLYDLLGVSGNFTDQKWGWTDLRSASVERVRGGYLLNLPRPEPLVD